MTKETLDPEDWSGFRDLAHRVLDQCLDRVEGARELPWRPTPDAVKARLSGAEPAVGAPIEAVMASVLSDIAPYATGNTHPRFFGWVHGSGLADGVLVAMIEAAMNSNCGGRDHGALYVEAETLRWLAALFGFGDAASGVLVSGTSIATLYAAMVARRRLRERADAAGAPPPTAENLVVYAGAGAHSCVAKAFDAIGGAAANMRRIPLDADRRMALPALAEALAADRAAGLAPLMVVATVGGVETGHSDEVVGAARVAREHDVWLHVDGAFGAWARLASPPWRAAADGIDAADSLAFDFHKWPSVAYACGAILVRDGGLHRRTFSNRPTYLESGAAGLAGGDPWYCDYGLELSRGFAALKVWTALKTHGFDGLGRVVDKCCRQAMLMARAVERSEGLRLSFEPTLNLCCFEALAPEGAPAEAQDGLNEAIAADLQISGDAVFSTVRLDGRVALRAAIVNHRTTDADIEAAVAAAAAARARRVQR